MTPEERDIISRFVQRVAGSPSQGSVPSTTDAPSWRRSIRRLTSICRHCSSNILRRGIA